MSDAPFISTQNLMYFVPPYRERINRADRIKNLNRYMGISLLIYTSIMVFWPNIFPVGLNPYLIIPISLLFVNALWFIHMARIKYSISPANEKNLRRAHLAAKADPFLSRIMQSIMHRTGVITNGEASHIFALGLANCTGPFREYQERVDAQTKGESQE